MIYLNAIPIYHYSNSRFSLYYQLNSVEFFWFILHRNYYGILWNSFWIYHAILWILFLFLLLLASISLNNLSIFKQLQIGEDFLPTSFSILEEQPMDMLLGLDMLKRHQVKLWLYNSLFELVQMTLFRELFGRSVEIQLSFNIFDRITVVILCKQSVKIWLQWVIFFRVVIRVLLFEIGFKEIFKMHAKLDFSRV